MYTMTTTRQLMEFIQACSIFQPSLQVIGMAMNVQNDSSFFSRFRSHTFHQLVLLTNVHHVIELERGNEIRQFICECIDVGTSQLVLAISIIWV